MTTGSVTIGSAFDCSTKWAGSFGIRLGRQSGSNFTSGWPKVRIEASETASGNNSWVPIYTYTMQVGSSVAKTTLNGSVSAAATTAAVTSATGFAIGDLVFIGDTSTANYEIARVKSISGSTLTFEEAVVDAHTSGANISNQSEIIMCSLDLTTYSRVRVVADNSNGGQTVSAEVAFTTWDS